MIAVRLKLFLMMLSALALTGCTSTQIKYVDKPYEVKVPVRCSVPDENCSFNRKTYTEIINSMRECIIEMKHNKEKCK